MGIFLNKLCEREARAKNFDIPNWTLDILSNFCNHEQDHDGYLNSHAGAKCELKLLIFQLNNWIF